VKALLGKRGTGDVSAEPLELGTVTPVDALLGGKEIQAEIGTERVRSIAASDDRKLTFLLGSCEP
jgi:hypothetical protein